MKNFEELLAMKVLASTLALLVASNPVPADDSNKHMNTSIIMINMNTANIQVNAAGRILWPINFSDEYGRLSRF